jgi:hypothetical protein
MSLTLPPYYWSDGYWSDGYWSDGYWPGQAVATPTGAKYDRLLVRQRPQCHVIGVETRLAMHDVRVRVRPQSLVTELI